jgi:hypothetical protein
MYKYLIQCVSDEGSLVQKFNIVVIIKRAFFTYYNFVFDIMDRRFLNLSIRPITLHPV